MSKSRPILFSAPMVRAILAGKKTQTRRVVKAINHDSFDAFLAADPSGFWGFDSNNSPVLCVHSPYGEVGDRLWVRETWCHAADDNGQFKYNSEGNLDSSCCHYRADGLEVRYIDGEETKAGLPKSPWCPSIHMPRWASRITLEITGLRIARLNDISVRDILREGIEPGGGPLARRRRFQELWESINGPDSWAANPWVWVVEFKVV